MSLDYGRYAVASVWLEVLLGGSILETDFAPENTDPVLINLIRQTVHNYFHQEA